MHPAFAPSLSTRPSLQRRGACSRLQPISSRPRLVRTRHACAPARRGHAASMSAGGSAGDTLICTSLTAGTAAGQLQEMEDARAAGADLAEVRVDLLDAAERARWPDVVRGKVLPVVVTNRAAWEGGGAEEPEEARLGVLIEAAGMGAEYVDVELAAAAAFSRLGGVGEGCKVILSHHNFERALIPAELESVHKRMVEEGVDVCKIAMAAGSAADVSRAFWALRELGGRPFVMLVMGELGQCSRVLAPKYGGYLTFASVGAGRESAPGQVTAADMLQLYRFRSIGPDTKVFGVIGNPVAQSMSPALHNASFADAGIDAVYVPLKVEDDVAAYIRTMSALGFVGFSVTIPGKVAALDAVDFVEPVTRRIGAMNTVVTKENGELWGYNTDWVAAISAVEDGLRDAGAHLAGARVLCLGAGGAARGLAFGALERGAREVVIANRTAARAVVLAEEVGSGAVGVSMDGLAAEAAGFDVVMNTTSVGMHPKEGASPLPGGVETLARYGHPLVFDAVYNPLETRLLRDAAAAGCACVSGVEMFVRQAAEQFELWYPGRKANVELMRSVVMKRLGAPVA